jgi:6-methylsalicylate decarboxylase
VRPWLDRFYYDVALSGGGPPMAALTELVGAGRILYGSDWPFVERDFVVDQLYNLMTMPHFAGDAFGAMERGNAGKLFKRFADESDSSG